MPNIRRMVLKKLKSEVKLAEFQQAEHYRETGQIRNEYLAGKVSGLEIAIAWINYYTEKFDKKEGGKE